MSREDAIREQRERALSFVDRLGGNASDSPSVPAQPAAPRLAIGCAAFEKRDGDNLRGGRVFDVTENDDGETVLHLVEAWRGGLLVERLLASEIDPATVEPPNKAKIRNLVRHVLRGIGARQGMWTSTDAFELGVAQRLVGVL